MSLLAMTISRIDSDFAGVMLTVSRVARTLSTILASMARLAWDDGSNHYDRQLPESSFPKE